jgi:hypothetical protein
VLKAWRVLNLADGQAASITQQAWAQINAIHETAERHAAVVRQQASDQIAAVRAAAEREAAALLVGRGGAGPAVEYGAESVSLPAPAALPAGEAQRPVTPPPRHVAGPPPGPPGDPLGRPRSQPGRGPVQAE